MASTCIGSSLAGQAIRSIYSVQILIFLLLRGILEHWPANESNKNAPIFLPAFRSLLFASLTQRSTLFSCNYINADITEQLAEQAHAMLHITL